ncbi:hypothetical protein [Salinifilum ghardaiensis]
MILIGLSGEAPAYLAQVAQRVPVVEIGQHTGAAGIDSVRTADVDGARLAADHLVEHGHRAIAHVDGAPCLVRRSGARATTGPALPRPRCAHRHPAR